MLCDYNCGKEANYILKNGKNCCSKSYSSCPSIRKKNSEGLRKAHSSNPNMCKHIRGIGKMNGWDKGGKNNTGERFEISLSDIFILSYDKRYSNEYLRQRILYDNLIEYKCSGCGIMEWNNKKINLQLHHIDGNSYNNQLNNLTFLCPNCHSQTETYCGKNINRGTKISDEEFIIALKESKNIRQTLIKLGLAPCGLNYDRAKKLMEEK